MPGQVLLWVIGTIADEDREAMGLRRASFLPGPPGDKSRPFASGIHSPDVSPDKGGLLGGSKDPEGTCKTRRLPRRGKA